jgi:hypothetical protein
VKPPHRSSPSTALLHGFVALVRRIGFAATTFASLWTSPAEAASLFVAPPPRGSDNNQGTEDLPFATINHAARVAQAGDTVWIAAGTYQPDEEVLPAASGTSEAPIVYRRFGDGEVIIDGRFKLPIENTRKMGIISIEQKSWIVLDGIRIINSRSAGVLLRGCTGITVQNCSTRNTYASGIIGALSSDIKVLHNTVQLACVDPGEPRKNTDECITLASVAGFEVAHNSVSERLEDTSNGGEGIDIKNACHNGSVHHNTVYDLVRLGIYIDAYSKELENVAIYANTVYRCRKGIVVACEEGGTARGVRIHDNVIYDCGRFGIQIAGYLKGGPIQDVAVYQNTIVRCGFGPSATESPENGGLMVDAKNPANRDFVVRNNILAANANQIQTRGQPYLTVDRNLLHGPSLVKGTNPIEADPLFVDASSNDFRLSAGSPAIAAALGDPQSATDHADIERPVSIQAGEPALADLGAFERSPTQDTPVVPHHER